MPVDHKFIHHDFNNGFATNNAILDVTPYKPEVLIIGTYNPNTIPNAQSDFFYSRNYFWPAIKNLFIHNAIALHQRRDDAGHIPTLNEIFEICSQTKLSFADLILKTLHHNNPNYILNGNIVTFNNQNYDLINDGDLASLHQLNQVNWNTNNILTFIQNTPSINQIYLTRQPTGLWNGHWNALTNHPATQNFTKTNIYTPSGQALPGAPRIAALLHHWLHNQNTNFGILNHHWLTIHNVNINNF